MRSLKVTAEDVRRFDAAVAAAFLAQSSVPFKPSQSTVTIRTDVSLPDYLYAAQQKLVMSFDVDWNPFLVNSRGFNDDANRWFLPFEGRMIEEIGRELKAAKDATSEPQGGRVFLTRTRVTRKPTDKEIALIDWSLGGQSIFLG